MTTRRFVAGSTLGVLAAAFAACSIAETAPVHELLQVAPGTVHVIVCTSTECPIANSYAPTLQRLHEQWAGAPVRWFVLHVDPDLSLVQARQHAVDYCLPGDLVLDPSQRLAARLGFQRTPEAAVLTADGVAYCGRIDDQWQAFGARSEAASEHDLRDAIAAALAGRPPSRARTTAVGCLLPTPAQ